jgi:hypothetical protein
VLLAEVIVKSSSGDYTAQVQPEGSERQAIVLPKLNLPTMVSDTQPLNYHSIFKHIKGSHSLVFLQRYNRDEAISLILTIGCVLTGAALN